MIFAESVEPFYPIRDIKSCMNSSFVSYSMRLLDFVPPIALPTQLLHHLKFLEHIAQALTNHLWYGKRICSRITVGIQANGVRRARGETGRKGAGLLDLIKWSR